MGEFVIVLVAVSSKQEAEKISEALLDERLIACANVVGPVSSLFWWKGKIDRAEEYVVFVKSRLDLFEKLSEKVKALHSYNVPEIIALPIVNGSPSYIKWLDDNLESAKK